MSGKESAKKINNTYNEANEALYDAFHSTQLPENFPVEPIWPEWSDSEVNNETWGSATKSKATTGKSGTGKSEMFQDSASFFFDPEQCPLPLDLAPYVADWKRPYEVFPPDTLTIYSTTETPVTEFTMKPESEFAAQCSLYKALASTCQMLKFYSCIESLPAESETAQYSCNVKGQPWEPWHHIYGGCKAGKDQPHRPVYVPYGKYLIRLYYLGAWRRLIVDDQIPYDAQRKCLLPLTENVGELWPIILTKAILKVASLTPTVNLEAMDLPIWTLLTGWVLTLSSVTNRTENEMWRLLCSLTPQYRYPEEQDKMDVKSVQSRSSKATSKKNAEKKDSLKDEEVRPMLMLALLDNFKDTNNMPMEKETVAILMTRDIPLKRAKPRKSTEPWKRIRWVSWAEKKGLWMDELLLPPYRCVQQINFSEEILSKLAIDPHIEDRLFIREEVPDSQDSDESSSADAKSPVQWVDFPKLHKYITELRLLLKPSAMASKYRLTYITLGAPSSTAPSLKAKALPNTSEFSTYYLQPSVRYSSNETPILYCDSSSGIFICFSLWVCPTPFQDKTKYLSTGEPKCMRGYRGSIIIEKYDWRTSAQSTLLAAIKTVGNASAWLFLNSGRHALKIWLDTDSPFMIEVYSNTELTIGKSSKIRFLMSTEAYLASAYINRVSVAFIDLTQKFGRPDQIEALAEFYSVVKPKNDIVKGYYRKMNDFIETFLVSLVTVLRTLVLNEEEFRLMKRALQSIFIYPNLTIPQQRTLQVGLSTVLSSKKLFRREVSKEKSLFKFLDRNWSAEETAKAIVIQKHFRGYRTRCLIKIHSPNHKEHKIISEKLKKISDLMFAAGKRDVEIARLVREIVASRPDLLDTFLFYREVSNVIVTEEFTGKIPGVEPKAWVPMIRFTFACHSADPLPCAFYHSCNLEQYTMTVHNNDTNEEVFRLINTTSPHFYTRNEKGYTVFVYGWNESETKTVNWRFEMIKMKYFLDIHPCNTILLTPEGPFCHPYLPQPLTIREVRNFYVPNKNNRICACLIKVRRKVLLTIRLAVSYEDARFKTVIRKLDGTNSRSESMLGEYSFLDDDVVINAEAKSSAIIFPAVILDHIPKSEINVDDDANATVYILEAHLVNNSWPLTKHEWGVIEPIRVNGDSWQENLSSLSVNQSRKSSTGSRRRTLRSSKTPSAIQKPIENPYWYLQFVSDLPPDCQNALEVTEDRSYTDHIKALKASWEEKDPGRRQRGKAIQREFLRKIFGEMQESESLDIISSGIIRPIDSRDYGIGRESIVEDSFELMLHEMRSFSYLLADKSSERYLKSPRILPWMPMEKLIEKYGRGPESLSLESTVESSRTFYGEDYCIQEVLRNQEEILDEKRKEMLQHMRQKRLILEEHITNETLVSCKLREQALEERRNFLEKAKALKGRFEKPKGGLSEGKSAMKKRSVNAIGNIV